MGTVVKSLLDDARPRHGNSQGKHELLRIRCVDAENLIRLNAIDAGHAGVRKVVDQLERESNGDRVRAGQLPHFEVPLQEPLDRYAVLVGDEDAEHATPGFRLDRVEHRTACLDHESTRPCGSLLLGSVTAMKMACRHADEQAIHLCGGQGQN